MHRFETVEQFLAATEIRNGVNTIWHNGLPIDFHFKKADSKVLLVMLNGAVLTSVKLPWFAGSGVTKDLDVNRVLISDPSLYLDRSLTLGWYSGNRFQPDLQQALVSIFTKVQALVGAERSIFYGTSGGGFAALLLSYFMPGSVAIPVNPQTKLQNHSVNSVGKWLQTCWGVNALEDLPDGVVTDVAQLYSTLGTNSVLYTQNSTDFHVGQHMHPFLSEADLSRTQLKFEDWGQGHVPPSKTTIMEILQNACELPFNSPKPDFSGSGLFRSLPRFEK